MAALVMRLTIFGCRRRAFCGGRFLSIVATYLPNDSNGSSLCWTRFSKLEEMFFNKDKDGFGCSGGNGGVQLCTSSILSRLLLGRLIMMVPAGNASSSLGGSHVSTAAWFDTCQSSGSSDASLLISMSYRDVPSSLISDPTSSNCRCKTKKMISAQSVLAVCN